jgi:hypothetical protein
VCGDPFGDDRLPLLAVCLSFSQMLVMAVPFYSFQVHRSLYANFMSRPNNQQSIAPKGFERKKWIDE